MRYLLVFIFWGLASSLEATFVEGPKFTFVNPTNELHMGPFDTKTNVSTSVINYGTLTNIGLGSYGVIAGTNSDTIANLGSISVSGTLSADGIFDKGGENFIYNASNIFASATGPAAGIRSLGNYEVIYSFGSINSSHFGIIFGRTSGVFNLGNITCNKSNCLMEMNPGGSTVLNGGKLVSSNSPAINLGDGTNYLINFAPIITSHPTAIETHGGDDQVFIGIHDDAPILGKIDGGDGYDTLTLGLFNSVTPDQRGNFLANIKTASPANGGLTFSSNTYTWINFENLIHFSSARTPADFNDDGFNDLVLQQKTSLQYLPMSNDTAIGNSPQPVLTLNKKDRVMAVNDFNFDIKPDLLVINKSSVRILTGTNFSTNFAAFNLGKGEKIIGTGDVKTNGSRPDIIIRKKKEIQFYRNTGTNFTTNATLLYTEKDGYKFVCAGRFGGDWAIVLRKKGKLEYRNITNVNVAGSSLSVPKSYKKVIGAADFSNGGDMELIAIKGKKVAIGDKTKAYNLSPHTRLVGPR